MIILKNGKQTAIFLMSKIGYPDNMNFSAEEIRKLIDFQEQIEER